MAVEEDVGGAEGLVAALAEEAGSLEREACALRVDAACVGIDCELPRVHDLTISCGFGQSEAPRRLSA